MKMIPTISIILFLLKSEFVSSLDQPEVIIKQGILKGLYTRTNGNRKISSFLGIPYAKPVTRENRFQEAVPAESWLGIYNATRPPPECLQLDHFQLKTPFRVHGTEDCLYINVYTPKTRSNKQDEKLLDVIVFIHGGAFMFMSSNYFPPTLLLDQDLVLVTFNYRLGPLGFASTDDETVPGNNGLKDQVVALKWIQENIEGFGGDPKSVTLAGISAGGASVHYHLLSPLSRGLFHKAIIMSGSSLNPWAQAENITEKTKYIANQLGCPTSDSLLMIKCLQNRPAHHIVELSRHFMEWLYNPYSPFGPTIENICQKSFISMQPLDILKSGDSADVPLLFSYTADEGLYPGAEIIQKNNLEELKDNWDALLPHILDYNFTAPLEKRVLIPEEIKKEYKINLNNIDGVKNFIMMLGDRLFRNGIIKTVKIQASVNKSPIYLYRFSYRGKNSGTSLFIKGDYGVSHGDDVAYILPNGLVNTQETDQDKQMSKKMIDLWFSFVSNGVLEKPWTPVKDKLPLISFIDIRGPETFVQLVDDYKREPFWEALGAEENAEYKQFCKKYDL